MFKPAGSQRWVAAGNRQHKLPFLRIIATLAGMKHPHGVVGHWKGGWDEAGLRQWAKDLRARLDAPAVTLGLLFTTPAYFDRAEELLELVRVYGQTPLLAGCSTHGLVVDGHEFEAGGTPEPGLALALYALPKAQLTARHLQNDVLDACDDAADPRRYLADLTGVPQPRVTVGWPS